MAKPKIRDLPDLGHLAVSGAEIHVRASPGAARNAVQLETARLRIMVTAAPENGKANAAVQSALAAAMGVAPSRLTLLRGHTSRDKVFVYSGSTRS